jgi:hypothetical protein
MNNLDSEKKISQIKEKNGLITLGFIPLLLTPFIFVYTALLVGLFALADWLFHFNQNSTIIIVFAIIGIEIILLIFTGKFLWEIIRNQ